MTIDQTTVTGVQVSERGKSEQVRTLNADLIVDASGRSSKLVNWLQDQGYDVPDSDRLKVSLDIVLAAIRFPSTYYISQKNGTQSILQGSQLKKLLQVSFPLLKII